MDDISLKIRDTILLLLDQKAEGNTICSGEAALHASPDCWRNHMNRTHASFTTKEFWISTKKASGLI